MHLLCLHCYYSMCTSRRLCINRGLAGKSYKPHVEVSAARGHCGLSGLSSSSFAPYSGISDDAAAVNHALIIVQYVESREPVKEGDSLISHGFFVHLLQYCTEPFGLQLAVIDPSVNRVMFVFAHMTAIMSLFILNVMFC